MSDLERMKYMVKAGIDPWLTSFKDMKADYKSSYDYVGARKSEYDLRS